MHLQHAAGNRAVQRLVNASRAAQPVQLLEAPVQRLGEEEEHGYTAYQPIAPAPASEPAAPPAPASPSGYGVYAAHALLAAPDPAPVPAPPPAAAAAAAPVTGPGGLAPISLPAKYRGEDREVGWRATYGMPEDASPELRARAEAVSHGTSLVTKYNTPEETAQNTLTPRANESGGKSLSYAAGGAASTRPVEYAMGPAGQVVANLGGESNERVDGQRRNIHHSTMLAGGDVAHAGHIGVAGGQVNYLDDDSGHYRPDEAHTYAAFNELSDQGVLNKDSAVGRVKMVDKSKTKGLDKGPDTSASVHFSGYQQAQGNETAIRNRGAVMDELLQKRPRYEGPAGAADAGGGGGGGGGGGMVYEPDDEAPGVPPVYSGMSGAPLSADRVAAGAVPPPPAPAPTPAPAPSPYSPYSPYTPMPATDASIAPPPTPAVAPLAPPPAPMPAGYGMSAASSAPAPSAAASGYSPYSPYTPMPATPDPASVPPGAAPSPAASASFLDEQL